MNAQEATRRRHVEFFESGHSIKQGHLRQLFRTQKAQEVAVTHGARLSEQWQQMLVVCEQWQQMHNEHLLPLLAQPHRMLAKQC